MCAGGDIKENHFIGTLLIVANGEFHGISDIAQAALFGFSKLDAAGDLASMDIEAWNDTFCNHGIIENATRLQSKRNQLRVSGG